SSPVQAPVGEGSIYVVRSGDTLWGIARRTLGPDASMAAIARLVDRLWTLNAKVIRSGDPDLIVPGERLRIPDAPPPAR
ncbi:MAG: LysM peptidoglycan-binding domain-containing protein, partial [Thermoleophilaceae bacterium]